MPPKIRELIRKLLDAGFVESSGKGSHKKFRHPRGGSITLSGALGDDAKPYQVRDVNKEIGRTQ
jgi:predicted RNA binding protein YcfA (HicA-like mRNA interferase family)